MFERQIELATVDGSMTTFICHPERGGPHPTILFYMDAPGIREELRDMARRLGTSGYYVMLPNLYYREGVIELGAPSPDPESPWRKKMMALMEGLTIEKVMHDSDVMLTFASNDPAAGVSKIGTVGYCMSGQYAINAAARYPEQVAAAASIYGVRLITEHANSPHMVAARARGELYFACAENDRWMPLDQIEPLKQALSKAKCVSEVELYPGTEHGFAFPARPVYHKASAERHWERLMSLFQRRLS